MPENVSLSRRTVTRRIEEIPDNLKLQLQKKADHFEFFFLSLGESGNVRDTAQLLLFIRGITKALITEDLSSMQSMKGTAMGRVVYGQKWDNLAPQTVYCTPGGA